MSTLPNDVCRCHDDGCPVHAKCLRWICRDQGGSVTCNALSMYPYDLPLGAKCPSFKAVKKGKK